jgi:tetratricopeptide (TPR) repeat protein
VLELESLNVKALFRRAQAYIETLDLDLAEMDIKKALEIDPQNREVRLEYKVLKQKQVEQNKKEAKLYGNMFSRLNKLEATEQVCFNFHQKNFGNFGIFFPWVSYSLSSFSFHDRCVLKGRNFFTWNSFDL